MSDPLPDEPEPPETPEPEDSRLNWSIWLVVTICFALVGGFLCPWLLPSVRGGTSFGLVTALGSLAAVLVNRLRPRYEQSTGGWRSFYDFLLRQMSLPD